MSNIKKALNEFRSQTKAMQAAIDFAESLDEAIKITEGLESAKKQSNELEKYLDSTRGKVREAEAALATAEKNTKVAESAAKGVMKDADKAVATALSAAQSEASSIITRAQNEAEAVYEKSVASQVSVRNELVSLNKERESLSGDVAKLNELLAAQNDQIKENKKRLTAFTEAANTL